MVFSEVYAKEAATLNLRGFVDPSFNIEIEKHQNSYSVSSRSNFEFFGYIYSDDVKVRLGELVEYKGRKTKKITVSIN